MKRILLALAALMLLVGVSVGAASGSGTHATTKSSSTTITHVCTNTSDPGAMTSDDMDSDGDTISITGPTTLWPPNHKYVTETITATDSANEALTEAATDPDGVTLTTTAVSNQPDGGLGSGNTADDASVQTPTNGSESATQVVKLRAERDGVDPTKAGRTYTINAMATFDGSNLESCNAQFTVHVPHDMGH
jgi:hypothetical protein